MSGEVIPLRPDHNAALAVAFAIVDREIGELWDTIIEQRQIAIACAAMEG